jgi:hypothetical protein
VTALLGQNPNLPPLFKEYAPKMTYYYKSPDPRLGPQMLKTLLKDENLAHPWLVKNDHVRELVAAQLGDIAAGKPKIVREYESTFPETSPAGRRVIIRALMNCGDAETLKRVDAWLADKQNAAVRLELEALAKHLRDPKRKHARDRLAREPRELDLLWVNFFITGEYAPVARILDVLDLPEARENAVLKRVARWSLGSNMQQHPRLVEILRQHARQRPAASRRAVEELLRDMDKKAVP